MHAPHVLSVALSVAKVTVLPLEASIEARNKRSCPISTAKVYPAYPPVAHTRTTLDTLDLIALPKAPASIDPGLPRQESAREGWGIITQRRLCFSPTRLTGDTASCAIHSCSQARDGRVSVGRG